MAARYSAKQTDTGPNAPFGFIQAGLAGVILMAVVRGGVATLAGLTAGTAMVLRPLVARIRSAPLASAAIGVVALGYGWAMANALLWQVAPPATFHQDGIAHAAARPGQTEAQFTGMPATPPVRPVRFETPITQSVEAGPDLVSAATPPGGNRNTFVVQTLLTRLGYFSGTIDGLYGPITAKAIRAFETAIGADVHGKLTPQLIQNLNEAAAGQTFNAPMQPAPEPTIPPIAVASAPQNDLGSIALAARSRATESTVDQSPAEVIQVAGNPAPDEAELVRIIQRGLASLGYKIGAIDGVAGDVTRREIRRFETFQSLQPTGMISPDLVDLLRNANAAI
ncbi:MAG: peptidoglycan-binding protein [Alphaproteobacteria bacterium]|nr:peptidoglycan-binding protein [Alphaproteobacteria bacterium]